VYTSKALDRYFPHLSGKTDADLFSAATARELRDHDLAAFMNGGVSKFDEITEAQEACFIGPHSNFPSCFLLVRSYLLRCVSTLRNKKKLEEQLRESEERYRAIAEITSDYAFAFRVEQSRKLTLEWITAAFSRISGLTPEEVLERDGWMNLPHQEDLPTVQRHRDAVLSGQEQTCEFRIIAKSGEVRWLRESMRPYGQRARRVARIYGAGKTSLSGNVRKSSCENG